MEEEIKLRILGTPVRESGRYVLHEHALTNRECGWICPRCNSVVGICPDKAGQQSFACSFCKTKFLVEVDEVKDGDEATFLPRSRRLSTLQPVPGPVSQVPPPSEPKPSAAEKPYSPAVGMLLDVPLPLEEPDRKSTRLNSSHT